MTISKFNILQLLGTSENSVPTGHPPSDMVYKRRSSDAASSVPLSAGSGHDPDGKTVEVYIHSSDAQI